MIKKIIILGIILVVLNLLDIITTLWCIRLGGSEANPIADYFIQHSHTAFWLMKLGVVMFVALWLLFAVWKFPQLYVFSRNALIGLNIFYVFPFLWNTLGILVLKGFISI